MRLSFFFRFKNQLHIFAATALVVLTCAASNHDGSAGKESGTNGAEAGCGLAHAPAGVALTADGVEKEEAEDGGETTEFVRVRSGGCHNFDLGESKRVGVSFSARDAAHCAALVLANSKCSLYHFEFDGGYCGCSGIGGNQCQGPDQEQMSGAIYRILSYDKTARPSAAVAAAALASAAAAGERGVRLHQNPSGMVFATTRCAGTAAMFERGMLELRRWAAAEGPAMQQKLRKKLDYMAVTYIMTRSDGTSGGGAAVLDLAGTPARISAIAQVLPKIDTDYIDNKRVFGRLARQAGVEGTVVPRTFDTTAAAIKALSGDPAASKVVFIKDVNGAGGQGVACEQVSNLANFKLSPTDIIQEGATNFALVNERKWTIRAYAVAHGGRLYMSRHFNGFKHPSPYEPDAVDLVEQHISNGHTSAHRQAGTFEAVGGRLMGPTDFEDADAWTEALINATTQMAPMYGKMVAATADDPHRYQIFGMDAIPREDGTVQIIEVNPFPNLVAFEDQAKGFGNPSDPALCAKHSMQKVKLVASVLRLLFGMETEASRHELVDVSKK